MNAEEFWARVTIPADESVDLCWTWTGGTNADGYAIARIDGQVRYCHHFVHDEFWGAPPAGQERRHLCGNRRCCNPYHIASGTHAENMADSGLYKLSDDQVATIRRRRSAGETLTSIARALGISRNYAGEICAGKRRPAVQVSA